MRILHIALLFSLFISLLSCNSDGKKADKAEDNTLKTELLAKAQNYFKPIQSIEIDPSDSIFNAMTKLGKILYFDKNLSKDGNISCNSCHNLSTYGVDNLATSPGDDGTFGTRNSPTVFNAALHTAQFWDGRAKDVEEQAGMPVTNPIEMGMPSEDFVIERISGSELYQQLFANAFPEDENPLNYENLTSAIGAFERTLITESRFDKFLHGDLEALSNEEVTGLNTFIKSGCIACHKNSLLGGDMFWKFGLFENYWEHTNSENIDKGKAEVTNKEDDNYIFKVPSLRNIEKTGPYLHDGSVDDLAETIRIMGITQVNHKLEDDKINEIVTFLKTLTADIPDDVKKEPVELGELY